MITPPDFNYSSLRDINFEIKLFAPDGNPIGGIPVQIGQIENDAVKKLFTLTLVFLGVLTLAACGSDVEELTDLVDLRWKQSQELLKAVNKFKTAQRDLYTISSQDKYYE